MTTGLADPSRVMIASRTPASLGMRPLVAGNFCQCGELILSWATGLPAVRRRLVPTDDRQLVAPGPQSGPGSVHPLRPQVVRAPRVLLSRDPCPFPGHGDNCGFNREIL